MATHQYEIVPHVGIGPVKLGMLRTEARRVMAEPVQTFEQSPERDFYLENAFQVFFDEHDRVEYIEASADDALCAIYKGHDLHRTPAEAVVALLERDATYDPESPELGYSYDFPDLELALWRPVLPEGPNDPDGRYFATVGVGRPGYFSRR